MRTRFLAISLVCALAAAEASAAPAGETLEGKVVGVGLFQQGYNVGYVMVKRKDGAYVGCLITKASDLGQAPIQESHVDRLVSALASHPASAMLMNVTHPYPFIFVYGGKSSFMISAW